jgi:hypothetical protein
VSNAHQLVAWASGALAVALLAAATFSWWTARRTGGRADHRFLVDRLLLATLALIAIAGLLGLGLLAIGARPADRLHVLYGVAALLTGPLAWGFGGRTEPVVRRHRDGWIAVGAAVVLAIGVRLAMTA